MVILSRLGDYHQLSRFILGILIIRIIPGVYMNQYSDINHGNSNEPSGFTWIQLQKRSSATWTSTVLWASCAPSGRFTKPRVVSNWAIYLRDTPSEKAISCNFHAANLKRTCVLVSRYCDSSIVGKVKNPLVVETGTVMKTGWFFLPIQPVLSPARPWSGG